MSHPNDDLLILYLLDCQAMQIYYPTENCVDQIEGSLEVQSFVVGKEFSTFAMQRLQI
jgi:hypothetical protein